MDLQTLSLRPFAEGIGFGEGPRWHDEALWLADIVGRQVLRVTAEGRLQKVLDTPGEPSGLGWLPDGGLLVVQMDEHEVWLHAQGKFRRYSGTAPLHDTRADREALRARMRDIGSAMRDAGPLAEGPGHYALGRGFLALGDEARAREHLEAAWKQGYQEPRVAYALALVLGHLYQEHRLEAERLRDAAWREAKLQEARTRYRDPAVDFLRRSEGARVIQLPSGCIPMISECACWAICRIKVLR